MLPDLRKAFLHGANLREVDLHGANLAEAHLGEVNLRGADLRETNISEADLRGADLRGAYFQFADLGGANLGGANLREAKLSETDISDADLRGADLRGANIGGANIRESDLRGADLSEAFLFSTIFADCDLSETRGFDAVDHSGPSTLGVNTLVKSRGRIPEAFLRGCGLSPWEVAAARLFDPSLSAQQITDIQYEIFNLRTKGPLFIGGFFISYSHADSRFVDKLQKALYDEGANVWRDVHHAVAGPLERQVFDAIRFNDVVLLVLSESSIKSDWVEAELEKALQREKKEGRDILLPVALDDAWKAKAEQVGSTVLWRQIKRKNILDFSQWKTKAFDEPFGKLVTGAKRYYAPATPTPGGVPA
jgi:hypothetical protein